MNTEPIRPSAGEVSADDPFYTLADHASFVEADEDLANENARLTNVDIDRALYGGAQPKN